MVGVLTAEQANEYWITVRRDWYWLDLGPPFQGAVQLARHDWATIHPNGHNEEKHMTYSMHGGNAEQVEVQTGTDLQIAENLGGEGDNDTEMRLVLSDQLNQHALVLSGSAADFTDLAGRILTQAMSIREPEAPNLVRLHIGGREWTFRLPNDDVVMLDANGRRYVGVTMPNDSNLLEDDEEVAVVTWDGDPNENRTAYPRGNKLDPFGAEYFPGDDEPLYRKCTRCHLFVEEQDPEDIAAGLARYVHNHRGDEIDEAIDNTHEPEPEPGPGAPLTWWKTWGPPAMRARFIDDETVDVLGQPLPRGRCDTCGAPCDAITGKCMREPEKHATAQP